MFINTVLVSALLAYVKSTPIAKRDVADDLQDLLDLGFVNTTTNSSSYSQPVGYVKQQLFDGPGFNAIPVTIGSDNQTVFLRLDSNTPDIWVNSDINEFCLAYVPSFNTSISNSSIWKDIGDSLKDQAASALFDFQQSADSVLKELPTASLNYQTYASARQSEFQSAFSHAKASATKEIGDILSAASITDFPKVDDTLGDKITSKAVVIGTEIATDAREFATKVTSVGDRVYTFVTRVGEEFATDVTSVGGQFATDVTSVGAEIGKTIATGATSVFGDVTHGVVNGWDRFTSNLLNNFKRDVETAVSTTVVPTATYDFIPNNYTNPTAVVNSSTTIDTLLYTFERDCSLFGVFDDSTSDSFVALNNSLYVFNSTDYAVGFLGNDTISIDGTPINATFAVADSSDSNIGVFGIGKSNDEFTSYPELLAKSGAISKAVYQLVFSSFESSIIFGAIDYSHIDGNITLVPFAENTTDIAFSLSGFNTSDSDPEAYIDTSSSFSNLTAVIDTSIKNLLLPSDVLDYVISSLNETVDVTYSDDLGRYTIDEIPTFYLQFGVADDFFSVSIENFLVPLTSNETVLFNETYKLSGSYANSSFYYDLDNDDISEYSDNDDFLDESDDSDADTYILSILPAANNTVVLGLDFFQDSIVAIIDLEDEQIGLASLDDTSDDETIVIITNEIPTFFDTSDFDDDESEF
ncbi:hypothetical protein CANINC_003358 [Pichia inconspicua]|uniref:Peptidase A1 domain-containing protein n=1 Tax=Pichia inconspicua TaxID=52247 RepID=A0A4T0X0M5_9ASCO|nr:hypothetical protein CANINC_003358 [[Candida] inconspicua]